MSETVVTRPDKSVMRSQTVLVPSPAVSVHGALGPVTVVKATLSLEASVSATPEGVSEDVSVSVTAVVDAVTAPPSMDTEPDGSTVSIVTEIAPDEPDGVPPASVALALME